MGGMSQTSQSGSLINERLHRSDCGHLMVKMKVKTKMKNLHGRLTLKTS